MKFVGVVNILKKLIIEKSSGHLLARYLIALEIDDNVDVDYLDEACMRAIYYGVVEPDKKSDNKIIFSADVSVV